MPSQESHDGPDRNDDAGLAQAQSHVLDLFPFANQLVCTVAHARQALRSRQKLREVLRAHLCRAFCNAHVSNCAYMDMPDTSDVQRTGNGWPSEEAARRLLLGTFQEGEARDNFDHGVFRLLWPRRDLSTLDDSTRLVTIFKTVLAEGGQRKARLYIDLLYRAGAGGAESSQIAVILLESV